jgi:hypothetical protein
MVAYRHESVSLALLKVKHDADRGWRSLSAPPCMALLRPPPHSWSVSNPCIRWGGHIVFQFVPRDRDIGPFLHGSSPIREGAAFDVQVKIGPANGICAEICNASVHSALIFSWGGLCAVVGRVFGKIIAHQDRRETTICVKHVGALWICPIRLCGGQYPTSDELIL